MKKTTTKKKTSPKKTSALAAKAPVVKKTVTPKKTAPKAKAEKSAPKKSVPVSSTPVKKVVKKSAVPKKKVSHPSESASKVETKNQSSSATNSPKEGVKMLGILHLVGNLLSGGALGIIFVIIYYFLQHEKLSRLEKETCFEIINFNLSFILYVGVAVGLIFAIVGIVLIPVVWITWFVLLVLGFLNHLVGDNYRYPLTIRFVS